MDGVFKVQVVRSGLQVSEDTYVTGVSELFVKVHSADP